MNYSLTCLGFGLGFVLVVVAGCVPHEDVRADGPVKSGNISVAIIDLACKPIREHEPPSKEATSVHMRLRIVNEGDTAITVNPGRIRLIDRTRAMEPVQAGAPGLLVGGAAMALDLEFVGEALQCPQTSAVSLAKAIEIGYIDIKFPLLSAAAPMHGA